MPSDIAQIWTDALSEAQLRQLQWLRDRKCLVEAQLAPADPLRDQPEEVMLEVVVDKHAIVKIRGGDIPEMFDKAFMAAQNLFNYVNQREDRL